VFLSGDGVNRTDPDHPDHPDHRKDIEDPVH
jgi:hypothetical protein